MNIFTAIPNAAKVLEQGKAIQFSTLLTNAEAGAAMLYGFLSAVIVLLGDFGIDLNIGGTDLHTLANGWSVTISIFYSLYRIATNPAAGVKTQ